jgi:hypothetical protein
LLQPGDKVLVAESCTHHPIEEDIGRVKIPRWLQKYVGGESAIHHVKGRDFPEDLSPYKLVIHCGACMWNRQEMMNRIRECHRQGVPITNYGLVIAYALGILERALEPFPEALAAYKKRGNSSWNRTCSDACCCLDESAHEPCELTVCELTKADLLEWLRESRPARLQELYEWADAVRKEHVGDAVHLRGLIEIPVTACGNACIAGCGRLIAPCRATA